MKFLTGESRDAIWPNHEVTAPPESDEAANTIENGIEREGRVDNNDEVAESPPIDSGANGGAHADGTKGGDSSATERENDNASNANNDVDSSDSSNGANEPGGETHGYDDDELSVV